MIVSILNLRGNSNPTVLSEIAGENWRIGELENWRIGELEWWSGGGLNAAKDFVAEIVRLLGGSSPRNPVLVS